MHGHHQSLPPADRRQPRNEEHQTLGGVITEHLLAPSTVTLAQAWNQVAASSDRHADVAAGYALTLMRTHPDRRIASPTEATRIAQRLARLVRLHRPRDPLPPVASPLWRTVTAASARAAMRASTARGSLPALRCLVREASQVPRTAEDSVAVPDALHALRQVRAVLAGCPASSGRRPETDGTVVPCPDECEGNPWCPTCRGTQWLPALTLVDRLDEAVEEAAASAQQLAMVTAGLLAGADDKLLPPWDAPNLWYALARHRDLLVPEMRRRLTAAARQAAPALAPGFQPDPRAVHAVEIICADLGRR